MEEYDISNAAFSPLLYQGYPLLLPIGNSLLKHSWDGCAVRAYKASS